MNASQSPTPKVDYRRAAVLLLAVAMLIGSAAATWYGDGGSGNFAAAAMGRIGLVMGALWLAWPSLKRPASWLPPGMPVAVVILLCVLAARPRLVIVAIPAFGVLLALSVVLRTLKR